VRVTHTGEPATSAVAGVTLSISTPAPVPLPVMKRMA
tara:strand:+ start:37246 stop:37356 length:111 start_codon:yes stop_codon:yes gene_type:complete